MKKIIASILFILFILPVFGQNEEALVLCNQGVAEYASKDYNAAVQSFNKALAIDSLLAKAWFNRAICKTDLKDYNGAIIDFNRSIDLNFEKEKATFFDKKSLSA